MPHADEWIRFKVSILFYSPEMIQEGGHGSSKSPDITELEHDVVGHGSHKKGATAVSEVMGTTMRRGNARSAVRSLRPEVLRQAGARTRWCTGRITAVLDRAEMVPKLPGAEAITASVKKSGHHLLIEVRYGNYYTGT